VEVKLALPFKTRSKELQTVKILFVHERFGALGGAEVNILATAEALLDRGHETGLLHGPGTGKEEDAWLHTFPSRFQYDKTSCGRAALSLAMHQFKPDVIFLHKMADPVLMAALAENPVPVVRMIHDHDLICMRSYRYSPFSRNICTRPTSGWCVFPCGACITRNNKPGMPLKWVSYTAKKQEIALNRKLTALIVASRYMKGELVLNGFSPDQISIHAPVPRPTGGAFESSFDSRNLLVYSGQIIRGKGVDVLLESLAKITTHFEAVIIGDGNHRAHCERLSRRLGLNHRVHFTGFVPQSELKIYHRTASVAVVSSVWPEPFGAVGLEAMRCGLPVVGFESGGIGEWLIDGETGYLVPWMDREQYAGRIEALLRNKKLARTMGENGRELSERRFSFAAYIRELESLLVRTAHARPILLPSS